MSDFSDYRRALSAIVKTLAPHATLDGRRSMAGKLAASGNGEEIANLAFRYLDIALLFHPDDSAAAASLALDIKAARESGEIQSIIPISQGGILATDLLTWLHCPSVAADNPLSYWLPISAGSAVKPGEPANEAEAKTSAASSGEPKPRKRVTKNIALLNHCISNGVSPHIEDVWVYIRRNASKEGFPIATANNDSATGTNGKKYNKANLDRTLLNMRQYGQTT